MKKNRFVIHITTLALAICVMMFGVYAAKSASLNSSGSIGFISHDADVVVDGVIYGAMRGSEYGYKQITQVMGEETKVVDSNGVVTGTVWQDSFTTQDDNAEITEADYLTSDHSWLFGDVFFDDMNVSPESTTIAISLKVSNYSVFPVSATIKGLESVQIDGIKITTQNQGFIEEKTDKVSSGEVNIIFEIENYALAEQSSLTEVRPIIEIKRTEYAVNLADSNVTSGEIVTETNQFTGTESNYYLITNIEDLTDGETLSVPSGIIDENGNVYPTRVIEASENGWNGYVNSEGTFTLTAVPEEYLGTTNAIEVPEIISYNGTIYLTKVCSTTEGYAIEVSDSDHIGYCLTDIPGSTGNTDLIIPAIVEKDGAIYTVSEIAFGKGYTTNNSTHYENVTVSRGIKTITSWKSYSSEEPKLKTLTANYVETIGEMAFSNMSELTSVYANNVKEVGSWAFDYCYSLENIEMPNVEIINESAFYNTAIKSVELKNCQIIGLSAFASCFNLADITLAENVQIKADAFYNCDQLKKVTLPKGADISDSYPFSSCGSLAHVINKTGNEITPDALFGRTLGSIDENLVQIKTTDNFTSAWEEHDVYSILVVDGEKHIVSVKDKNITSAVIPDDVEHIAYAAFNECYSLSEISLANVKTIAESAFDSCSELTFITLPSTLESMGNGVFASCKKLFRYVNNSSLQLDSFSLYGEDRVNEFVEIKSSESEFEGEFTEDGMFKMYTLNGKSYLYEIVDIEVDGEYISIYDLEEVTIPTNVSVIGNRVFEGLSSLKTVNLNNVEIIKSNAFASAGLTSVDLSKVIIIDTYAFGYCEYLTATDDVLDLSNVQILGSAVFEYVPISGFILSAQASEYLSLDYTSYETKFLYVPQGVSPIEVGGYVKVETDDEYTTLGANKIDGYTLYYNSYVITIE